MAIQKGGQYKHKALEQMDPHYEKDHECVFFGYVFDLVEREAHKFMEIPELRQH